MPSLGNCVPRCMLAWISLFEYPVPNEVGRSPHNPRLGLPRFCAAGGVNGAKLDVGEFAADFYNRSQNPI
jgi:hypothetical protein